MIPTAEITRALSLHKFINEAELEFHGPEIIQKGGELRDFLMDHAEELLGTYQRSMEKVGWMERVENESAEQLIKRHEAIHGEGCCRVKYPEEKEQNEWGIDNSNPRLSSFPPKK